MQTPRAEHVRYFTVTPGWMKRKLVTLIAERGRAKTLASLDLPVSVRSFGAVVEFPTPRLDA